MNGVSAEEQRRSGRRYPPPVAVVWRVAVGCGVALAPVARGARRGAWYRGPWCQPVVAGCARRAARSSGGEPSRTTRARGSAGRRRGFSHRVRSSCEKKARRKSVHLFMHRGSPHAHGQRPTPTDATSGSQDTKKSGTRSTGLRARRRRAPGRSARRWSPAGRRSLGPRSLSFSAPRAGACAAGGSRARLSWPSCRRRPPSAP